MIKKTRTINTKDLDLSKVQDNLTYAIDTIGSKEIIDGIVLKNINLLSSGPNVINHKLGRGLVGWYIIRKRANSDIWDSQDTNPTQAISLILNCTNNVTVDIWVF